MHGPIGPHDEHVPGQPAARTGRAERPKRCAERPVFGDLEALEGCQPMDDNATPAFIFDLDGTLIDSVYEHVLAWRDALAAEGVALDVWRIHRRIGMSGGLLVNALARETGRVVAAEDIARLEHLHSEAYAQRAGIVRPLKGARELLCELSRLGVPWAIATSGRRVSARRGVAVLGLGEDLPLVTRDDVSHAKPDPDLFMAAARRLRMPVTRCVVVGDSVWDILAARRASALGVGVLSGGYGQDELERAGAYRVYGDPAGLLCHLDELGVRTV